MLVVLLTGCAADAAVAPDEPAVIDCSKRYPREGERCTPETEWAAWGCDWC